MGHPQALEASIQPGSFDPGNAARKRGEVPVPPASIQPGSFDPGNLITGRRLLALDPASIQPGSFDPGNPAAVSPCQPVCPSVICERRGGDLLPNGTSTNSRFTNRSSVIRYIMRATPGIKPASHRSQRSPSNPCPGNARGRSQSDQQRGSTIGKQRECGNPSELPAVDRIARP